MLYKGWLSFCFPAALWATPSNKVYNLHGAGNSTVRLKAATASSNGNRHIPLSTHVSPFYFAKKKMEGKEKGNNYIKICKINAMNVIKRFL
jgi:hypothetical protein